ncbi:rRNA maturation RNase YbeY [Silvanigrella aquatica]|uniref:Endoribonuclease YbeY n=1 Tax=Silvanigrella aquatica TaxID=1915309 RepID=A0A1L4CXT4_9BACT|nr:rRNA maturation RNase YbeY [Silvanigrella aquatica]APJ02750.1 rRNA maturation RNase YbeY [Silvanigrella aquatica]
MNKVKKIKFKPSVVFSTKKYNRIKKTKDGSYLISDEKINCSVSLLKLKKRITFILSLTCDFSTEMGIRICDETEMLSTNSYFRGKNYPTDVLSFPCTDDLTDQSEYSYLGDILICLPVCFNQAIQSRVSISQELERMIIHGIVHLKGFDHERNQSAWKVMTNLENSLQKELHNELGKPDWCDVSLSRK